MALSAQDWDGVMRAPLFKAMGATIARRMIASRQPRSYARGERLFEQGGYADGFFCIMEGWVKLYRLRENGEEVVLAIFSAGETFAEAAMFLEGAIRQAPRRRRRRASSRSTRPTCAVRCSTSRNWRSTCWPRRRRA